MWALGCVLYTLLCGFPPFYDESINVLTEKVARGHYTFLSPWWDDISHTCAFLPFSLLPFTLTDFSLLAKDLIQHLLCVDPAQRYTIDEFLAHPWCNAAPAPAPPPTPMAYPASMYGLNGNGSRPLDSPLLTAARGGRAEGRSPGLATLKEAFDITYAVHRMEEEGARRRAYNGRGGAGTRGFLQGLNEDDEEEDDPRLDAKSGGSRGIQKQPAEEAQRSNDWEGGRAGQRDRGSGKRQGGAGGSRGFELDMHSATLLGRRGKKGPAGSPLAAGGTIPTTIPSGRALPPGSPMHL